MNKAIHFVGFAYGDQRWWNAVAVFGMPDFIHPGWDKRARREIADDDIVVFAKGSSNQAPRDRNYDDPNQ